MKHRSEIGDGTWANNMKARSAFTVISIVILAACSKTPSESDGKAVIVNALGGCSRISLDAFEKTNGMTKGEQGYQLAVKYSLKISPPENSASVKNNLDIKTKEVTQKLQQAQLEYDALNTAAEVARNKINGGTFTQEDVNARNVLFDRRDKAENVINTLKAAQHAVSSEPLDSFVAACAKTDQGLIVNIVRGSTEYEIAHPGQNAFLSGFTVNLTGDLNLVKTDNGWKQGL